MPDKSKETVAVYDKIAEEYAKAFDAGTSDDCFLDKFLAYLPKGANILDVGCGTGRIANYYTSQGHHVIGIDLFKSNA